MASLQPMACSTLSLTCPSKMASLQLEMPWHASPCLSPIPPSSVPPRWHHCNQKCHCLLHPVSHLSLQDDITATRNAIAFSTMSLSAPSKMTSLQPDMPWYAPSCLSPAPPRWHRYNQICHGMLHPVSHLSLSHLPLQDGIVTTRNAMACSTLSLTCPTLTCPSKMASLQPDMPWHAPPCLSPVPLSPAPSRWHRYNQKCHGMLHPVSHLSHSHLPLQDGIVTTRNAMACSTLSLSSPSKPYSPNITNGGLVEHRLFTTVRA